MAGRKSRGDAPAIPKLPRTIFKEHAVQSGVSALKTLLSGFISGAFFPSFPSCYSKMALFID